MQSDGLQVYFVDVGQGDMTVVVPPSKCAILIDCPPRAVDTALRFLDSKGIDTLGLVIISHSDEDHIGGIVDLIESFPGQVQCLMALPDRVSKTKSYTEHLNDLVGLLRSGRVRRSVWLSPLGMFPTADILGGALGGLELEILHPALEDYFENDLGQLSRNDASIVLRITYQGVSFLLTGDIGKKGWELLAARHSVVKADVLKYPHHGGCHDKVLDMVQAVGPKVAVMSVGSDNSYGHPTLKSFQALLEVGAEILCTQATNSCMAQVQQYRPMIIAAHSGDANVGLGLHGGAGCPCAGTVCISASSAGLVVDPVSLAHDRVKDLLTHPQCRPRLARGDNWTPVQLCDRS